MIVGQHLPCVMDGSEQREHRDVLNGNLHRGQVVHKVIFVPERLHASSGKKGAEVTKKNEHYTSRNLCFVGTLMT